MKRSIPQIQKSNRFLAECIAWSAKTHPGLPLKRWAAWLRRNTTELYRVKSIRRAPNRAPMPTPAQVRAVRIYCNNNPDVSYRIIANKFGVGNDGRVSEIMRGKRGRHIYNRRGVRMAGR